MSNTLRTQRNKLIAVGTTGAAVGSFLLSGCAPSETSHHSDEHVVPGTTLTATPKSSSTESCKVTLGDDGSFAAVAIFKVARKHATSAKVELTSSASIGIGEAWDTDPHQTWDNNVATGQTVDPNGTYHSIFTTELSRDTDTLHITGQSAAPVSCEATLE